VSVDKATGKIKVHNYWIAVDPGLVIQQSNFNDYHVMRMSDMPELHIKIIATDNPPTGMGEVGIPTVAPAIGNAVAQLTGKRLRHCRCHRTG
jgi:isoquinoline 1-oxidoreductase beta subunit